MSEIEELKEALKQVNRRLMNAEASIRILEKRIDAAESLMRADEERTAANTKKIFQLGDASTFALKKDLEALKKYLKLVDPADTRGGE